MEDVKDIKPFTEMTSRELFVILTGGGGVMQQIHEGEQHGKEKEVSYVNFMYSVLLQTRLL